MRSLLKMLPGGNVGGDSTYRLNILPDLLQGVLLFILLPPHVNHKILKSP